MTSSTITASAAGTRTLGDLTIHRMGYGSLRLTGGFDGPAPDRAETIALLHRAVDLGVDHIDTAAFYFSPLRSANELINSALAPYPDDLVITTKVWPGRAYRGSGGGPTPGSCAARSRRTCVSSAATTSTW